MKNKIAERWAKHICPNVGPETIALVARELMTFYDEAGTDDYTRGVTAGLEMAAKAVGKAGEEWSEQAHARKSKTYSAYVIAALDIEGRIRALVPVPTPEEKDNG